MHCKHSYQLDRDLASNAALRDALANSFAGVSGVGRADLLPSLALERLALHDELCTLKWGPEKANQWLREGFPVSKRVSSVKRYSRLRLDSSSHGQS